MLVAKLMELREKARNPVRLLQEVGRIVVRDSIRSFRLQRLGDIEWPVRYPSQRSPKINVAGALQDFANGESAPKANRFQDSPALIDKGELRDSITFALAGRDTVKIRADKPYARTQQEGGESTVDVSKDGVDRLKDWLASNQRYAKHFSFLLSQDTPWGDGSIQYTTQVNARPFIGVTDDAEAGISTAIKGYFQKRGA